MDNHIILFKTMSKILYHIIILFAIALIKLFSLFEPYNYEQSPLEPSGLKYRQIRCYHNLLYIILAALLTETAVLSQITDAALFAV